MKQIPTETAKSSQLAFPDIIPHHPHWIKQSQQLEQKQRNLHQAELWMLKTRSLPWPGQQLDRITSCLDTVRQLMTDVDNERKALWHSNGNGRAP
jgi:hypothetical protein